MKGVTIKIFTKAKDLPHLSSRKFFHSKELFDITAQSPGCSPYMFVAYNEQSEIIARLAKQMINNADIVLRTNKLQDEGKLKDRAIVGMIGE